MITQKIKVSDLKPSAYNPRTITEKELEKLKRSITEFGYIEPVIWNKKTNTIVGGHQRVKAMLDLGMGDEKIEVVVVDLPEGREKALNAALNRISGEWDNDLLAQLLQEMTDEERELSGFDASEISKLLDSINKELEPEDDDITKLSKPQLIALVNKFRNAENGTVVREAKPRANDAHPTMKPVELVAHFVRNSSKLNDIILDPFGGSGSTLIVAESLGRKCLMMELDPKYVDVIIRRWQKKTGKKAVLLT